MKTLNMILKETISKYTIIDYTEDEDINKYAEEVFNILLISYKGDLKDCESVRKLKKNTNRFSIIFVDNKIQAAAAYRNTETGGFKLMYIGCIQNNDGKEALQCIIKRDINNNANFYWCECSGVIEHYFKKYEGFPVPNIFASDILDKRNITLCNDEFHYKRAIGKDAEIFTKVIFGFPSKEIAEKVINDFVECSAKRLNFLNSPVHENRSWINPSFTDQEFAAMSFINELDEYFDDGLQEMPNYIYTELYRCIDILQSIAQENRTARIHINRASYLLDHMPLLQIHKL